MFVYYYLLFYVSIHQCVSVFENCHCVPSQLLYLQPQSSLNGCRITM